MSEEIKTGLVRKLCEVMAEAGYVQKRGHNERFNYSYATEADVVDALREKLAKRNVFIFPSVVNCERKVLGQTAKGGEMFVTDVMIEWTFVDGETGETHSCYMPGCGSDTGDKGTYKAITGSSKYLFLKAFMLPTGDDPENEKPDREEGIKAAQAVATEKLRQHANGREIVSLTPYMEGFVALSGPGFNIVKANMDAAVKGNLGLVIQGNVYMIPTSKKSQFVNFCTAHQVSVIDEAPQDYSQELKQSIAKVAATKGFDSPVVSESSTDPIILSAKKVEPKGKKAFVSLNWGGKEMSTFDTKLWPAILGSIGKTAHIEYYEKGKYRNLIEIVRLDGKPFTAEEEPSEPDWAERMGADEPI